MKKLIPILGVLMLLTGCQSLDTLRSAEKETKSPQIMIYTDLVMDNNREAAEALEARFQTLPYKYGYKDDISLMDASSESHTYLGINSPKTIVQVRLTDSQDSKEALEILHELVGEGLQSFLDEASSHQEPVYLQEKVIGSYGVLYQRSNDEAILNVVASMPTYLNKEKADQIKAFCGEQLIVTAATAGQEKSMVELSFPSYLGRHYSIDLNPVTGYYQVVSDAEQEIEQVKLIIKKHADDYAYNQGVLDEDTLLPLRRMLQAKQISTENEMKIVQAINKVINEESSKENGTLGSVSYEVEVDSTYIYYEKFIEVTIHFN